MPASKTKTINLLIQEGFEHTQLGKILNWLLTAGRTIVVVTELVVITAFLSRFWLDKTLTDLNEQNALKKAQVEASLPFEKDFRAIQSRLSEYKKIETSKTDAIKIFSYFIMVTLKYSVSFTIIIYLMYKRCIETFKYEI